MKTASIRFRLTAWYAGLLTAVVVALSAILFLHLEDYLERTLEETQLRRARQIAETLVSDAPRTGEAAVAQEVARLYVPEKSDRFIRLTGPDGRVFYISGAPNDQAFDPGAVPLAAPSPLPEFSRRQPVAGSPALLIGAVHVPGAGGSYLVEVGTSAAPVEALFRHLLLLLALGLPVVIVLAAAGGYFLVGRALRPVAKVAGKAEEITQHNLGERLPVARTGDELEGLSIALNHMITRLEDAFRNSKRFVADASHELRTPLTILRGELEVLAQEPDTPPEQRERLGSLLEEVERLSQIVERLFALSRLDAGEAQVEWVRFDLRELTAGVADQMTLLAEDKPDRRRLRHRAGRPGGRRPRPAEAGGGQPPRQRHQVHPGGRHGAPAGDGGGRPGPARGERHRHRHPGRGAAARLRPLFPRRPIPLQPAGGSGPGPGHRQIHLQRPRRHGRGRKRPPAGQQLPRQTATGPTENHLLSSIYETPPPSRLRRRAPPAHRIRRGARRRPAHRGRRPRPPRGSLHPGHDPGRVPPLSGGRAPCQGVRLSPEDRRRFRRPGEGGRPHRHPRGARIAGRAGPGRRHGPAGRGRRRGGPARKLPAGRGQPEPAQPHLPAGTRHLVGQGADGRRRRHGGQGRGRQVPDARELHPDHRALRRGRDRALRRSGGPDPDRHPPASRHCPWSGFRKTSGCGSIFQYR